MGSIVHIDTNFRRWRIREETYTLKITNEPIITAIYGEYDDDSPGRPTELKMYFRKSIFEKLLSGEYIVDFDSALKRELRLADKDGNIIEIKLRTL